MNFRVIGSGATPVLCVHGWCCESGQFDELARRLGEPFRVFLPDLPGHGHTPLGDFQPSFENYAAALVAFALGHGLETAILLGHSMGGALSLMAAASGRIRPRAIINLDGSLPAAPHVITGQASIRTWLDEPDFLFRLACALREGFFLPQEREDRCESIVRTMCAAPEEVLRFLPEQIGSLDAAAILPAVTAPALYIGASRPRFDSDRAAALVPNISFAQIEDVGHFLHVYATKQVADLSLRFLASLEITS
jgi:pimeloyl-ACP methyl ester carboxylesterase